MDWKLELLAIPVSDVDRAKAFYTDQAGFNADHEHRINDSISLCSADCSSWSRTSRPRAPSSSSEASM